VSALENDQKRRNQQPDPQCHLQEGALVWSPLHVATSAIVQFGTDLDPESQSLAEQTQILVSMAMQHFWSVAGTGHAFAATPVSVSGMSAVALHWQRPSVESFLHAYESHAHRSALLQHAPCSPLCVATDELLHEVTSSGWLSRETQRHPLGVCEQARS
jgi:hypothetical protein